MKTATLDRRYVAHTSSNNKEQEQQTTRASTLYLSFTEDTTEALHQNAVSLGLFGFAFGSVIAMAARAVMACGHSDVLTPVMQCQNRIAVKCGLITKYLHTCTAASCQDAGY